MYDGFYNLSQKPFQLSADPDFFFQSSVHKRALAYMQYGLTQGEGFVLVTGSPGTGKTMLVKSLVKNLNKDKLLIGVMMTSQVGPEDTLRLIASTFGFQYLHNDKASLLNSFEKFIIEKAREGRRLLLIIDEAQNLPKQSLEELRMLTNLDVNGTPVFQVFLVGQPELKRTIYATDMEQLKQRIVSTFHLDPLDEEETKEYILFRLQTAGWQGKPEFDPNVFSDIHDFSAGTPRRINSLCDRLLLFGYLEELSVLDSQAVEKVISEVNEEMKLEDREEQAASSTKSAVRYSDAEAGSLEERLQRVEDEVLNLHNIANKEKALLRKAILIQLDMDTVYDSGKK
ncbi:XrtA/PEP-CTERM system-associated ATPase [Methylomonas methanica]|uniref:Secretion ATPase, PEP-CTERM locus subfamily n=1 Tax=Methylomonas methanica (strain DSM 25384 / MC09) TaxID=857087 RepID=F9ZY23_METMM|nr:XrtA/PEP-CTERM system-associated ATPase [Methylomonas methanica]AEF99753.1 secretion ATPase, PEP-CTERM locus subfamily [Methylomonas methanica MC09]